jgi:arylsulfatase A-like enzyme
MEHAGLPVPEDIDGLAWGRGRYRARSWLFRLRPGGVGDARFDRELRSVLIGDWKLVHRRPGKPLLFNVATDPGELHDLAAVQPERLAALEAELDVSITERPQPAPLAKSDPDTLERLRALGYVE